MALPTDPDLDPAREEVERLMTDQCIIFRDIAGVLDDVLDPDSLVLVRPPDNDLVIYDDTSEGSEGRSLEGKCRLRIRAETDPHVEDPGQRQLGPRLYELFVPWDAPIGARGDHVLITFSLRDETLVDQAYTVADVIRSSLLVHRKYILRDWVPL